jgi:hypothetical protein
MTCELGHPWQQCRQEIAMAYELGANVTIHHRARVTKTDVERFAAGRSTAELLQESFQSLYSRQACQNRLTAAVKVSMTLPISQFTGK